VKIEGFVPSEVVFSDRLRGAINEKTVSDLMESIKRIGLREAPTVRWRHTADGEAEVVLVAGRHRVEACVRLGMPIMDCVIFEGSEDEALLWEIAENLHRNELTSDERREHYAAWVKITADKVLHGATPLGGFQPLEKAIRKAAVELGVNAATISRAVAAESLTPEVKVAADEAGIGTVKRAEISREPNPAAQLAAIKREQDATDARKANREADKIIDETRVHDIKEYLAARLDVTELHDLGLMMLGICNPLAKAIMREAA
jgi:hypothetical protein